MIQPMPGQDEWIHTGLLAPTTTHLYRPPGWSTILRIRDPNSPRNPYRVSRKNKVVKCGKLHKDGHNSRGRRVGIIGETTWQRRQRLVQQKKCKVFIIIIIIIFM